MTPGYLDLSGASGGKMISLANLTRGGEIACPSYAVTLTETARAFLSAGLMYGFFQTGFVYRQS